MSDKQIAMKVIADLPNDIPMKDILEALALKVHVLEGINDAENGNVKSTDEVLEDLKQWL